MMYKIDRIEEQEYELVQQLIKSSGFLPKKSWPKPLWEMAVDGLRQKIWTGYGIFSADHELLSYLDYKVRSPELVEVGICCTRKDNRRQGLIKNLLCYLILQYPHCEIIIGTSEHNLPMINCIQSTGFTEDFTVLNDRVDGSSSIHYKRKGDLIEQLSYCSTGYETGRFEWCDSVVATD